MKYLTAAGASLLASLYTTGAVAASAADDIQVVDPYVRAVPAMMKNSAIFMTLQNAGDTDRALVNATSTAAEVVELHTHIHDGGVMRMRQIDRIDVSAGASTVLEPGGLHVMLLGLTGPLEVGGNVELALTFDDGSGKTITAPVRSVTPPMHKGMAGEHAGHGMPGGDHAGHSMHQGQ